jgi:two-component system, OmpR family, copper resistance phosphate regulon response regulator CusR
MESNKRILVVEDEKKLADIIKAGFEEQGFIVDTAYDGYFGKNLILKESFDLIILDINIPFINGYELCKEIRVHNKTIPIIMLTAMGASENKLTGFDMGADDYVVKPFDFMELLARVKVFLRRSVSNEPVKEDIIRIDDLVINTSKNKVFRGNFEIELTSKEYSLLEYLAKNKGMVVSRSDIAKKIWDLNFDTGTNYIDVYINYLRRKIDKDHINKLIHTKVGLGYILKDQREQL